MSSLGTVPHSWNTPGPDATSTAAKNQLAVFDRITESVFGQPDPNAWHPLPISTFFSEGWNEAWVPPPKGSGGAPRQGWINATDGNIYRVSLFTFAQGFNQLPQSNAYLGAFTTFTPLSRRLDLIIDIPFVLRNNADSGFPILDPSRSIVATSRSRSGFGNISITPRVLLHETTDFSIGAEFSVSTPTGTQPLAGNAALTPAIGFWNNFAGRWVICGGLGLRIPTQGGGGEDLISQLAIGKSFVPHDVPLFGDFTCYVSAVVNTPLSNSGQTSVTLTPGMRTHLGQGYYFLAGLPTPMTNERVADLGLIFWFIKSW